MIDCKWKMYEKGFETVCKYNSVSNERKAAGRPVKKKLNEVEKWKEMKRRNGSKGSNP